MKRFAAGAKVVGGCYWNTNKWELALVAPEGGVLAGAAGDRLVKLPLLLALAAAAGMGLAYVMFLPFIGFAMVLGLLAKRALRGGQRAALELVALVHPAWRPGEAYLTGKRQGEHHEGPPAADAALDRLAEEVAARRRTETK